LSGSKPGLEPLMYLSDITTINGRLDVIEELLNNEKMFLEISEVSVEAKLLIIKHRR
jgi:hypothetical protein